MKIFLLLIYSLSLVLFSNFLRVAGEDLCDMNHFRCTKSPKCIPISWRCDDDVDCNDDDILDSSDEENCPAKTCASDEMVCETEQGQCIPGKWVCDTEVDCIDGSDETEKLCGPEGFHTCNVNEFDCGDGVCLHKDWQCDGNRDCANGRDEDNCDQTECLEDEFQCLDDGRCINNIWRCDGDRDCNDNSDEANCTNVCKEGQFNCSDGSKCYESNWRCDGDFDCYDHSDELGCKICDEDDPSCKSLCAVTEFTCASEDECIHKSWLCDGDQDCIDGSDEGAHCNYTKCRNDQFQCDDHYCIPKDLRCNLFAECPDGSDEKNCSLKKTCVEKDEFDCYNDGLYCIPHSKVCDGINDCQHREDEDTAMCLHTDPCMSHQCDKHAVCVKFYPASGSKAEARCECKPGFKMHDDGYCFDIDECESGTSCSQICKNLEGSYECNCKQGYVLENGYFCRARGEYGEYPWLYYANRRDIRRLRVDSRFMEVIVEETENSIALDFDYDESRIFWTDGANEQINSARLKKDSLLADEITTVLAEGVKSPDGLAVDWLFKHLYWTDTGSNTISVANYDGTKTKILINFGLDDPRAISVDPEYGNMYWTDWGQAPKIERCGMDGQNRKTIVSEEDGLAWPNGLTIDYVGRRLYWIDAKLHKIGTVKMNGDDRKFVLMDPREISRPFGISVFEDSLYWTDWKTNSIRSVNKLTGRSIKTLSLGSYSVMDIKVYHEMRQERYFAANATALCYTKQCEFMCLPGTKVDSNPLGVSCVCANSYELNPDQKTCRKSAVTPMPKVTTEKTTPKPVKSTPVVVVTTGKGYTVATENKTGEHIPGVQPEGPSGLIAIITSISVAVILIMILAVGCFVYRRFNAKNRKSMNFDNPVYRKTTTTEEQSILEEEGQIHIPSQMQPLTAKEHV